MAPERNTALVVEDDPDLRKLLKLYLASLGFEVLQAADGASALNQLRNEAVNLVCLDLMLPEQSGYDLCDVIRKDGRLKELPVLMMSARSLPEDRAQAEEAGADAYLVKPFSREAFTRQVHQVLELFEARKEPA